MVTEIQLAVGLKQWIVFGKMMIIKKTGIREKYFNLH